MSTVRLARVAVKDLVPHRRNVRTDLEDLDELAASLEAVGLLQPLLVKAVPRAGGRTRFEVIDGNRRTHALRSTAIDSVVCMVVERAGERSEVAAMMAASMHRELKPMDQARGFQRLVDTGMSAAQIAAATGFSTTTVSGRLALLTLPPAAQAMVDDGRLRVAEAARLARQSTMGPGPAATMRTASKSSWLGPSHRLAGDAAARCDHQGARVVVGRTACGQCWEQAIVADTLALAGLPSAV